MVQYANSTYKLIINTFISALMCGGFTRRVKCIKCDAGLYEIQRSANDGKTEREQHRQFGAVLAVMLALCWTPVVKRALSWKAKLSICRSIYFQTSPVVMSSG